MLALFNTCLSVRFHQVHTPPEQLATRQCHPELQHYFKARQSIPNTSSKNRFHLRHTTSQVWIDVTMQEECLKVTN